MKGFIMSELAIVDLETFALHYLRALEESPQISAACSPLDEDTEPEDTVYRLATDGRSGYAVRPDGELVFVWSQVRGRGDAMVWRAVNRDGARYLDCFDGYLPTLYGRHGFEESSRVPNWTPGEPDVVYMALPGHHHRHGIDREG